MIIWNLKSGNKEGQESEQQKLEKGMIYIEKLKEDYEVEVENKGTHFEIQTHDKSSKIDTEPV